MHFRLGPLAFIACLSPLLALSADERQGARLVDQSLLPLKTRGRYIVNTQNERVKWACINWAGAYSKLAVVGGLEVQNLDKLAGRIKDLGFNCVRLCYSTQNFFQNPIVNNSEIAANPQLSGQHFLQIFDSTVKALTDQGIMVIINNHLSSSGWCCNVKQAEGFWYTPEYSEKMWIKSLVDLTARYKSNKLVVAYDIRNEPHDIPGRQMTWGDGNEHTDWAAAAMRAGNAVLAENPDVLIVVSALCFCMDLRPVKQHQITFDVPNRLVYETHNYIEFQMATLMSNKWLSWKGIYDSSVQLTWILLVLFVASLYIWFRLGKPWPPRCTLLASAAAWLSILAAVGAIICGVAFKFYSSYCSFVAKTYFLPYTIFCSVLSLSLLLFCIIGCRYGPRGILPTEGCNPICPEITDDETSGSDLDSDLQNLKGSMEDSSVAWSGSVKAGIAGQAGYKSWRIALDYTIGAHRHSDRLTKAPPWDRGMFIMAQFFVFVSILIVGFSGLASFAHVADTFWYMRFTFDSKWGFVLAEGYPYTAPVWMGEFGQNRRGAYWLNMLKYLAERDVDFAYWPLNGRKYTEGYFDSSSNFVFYDQPKWEDEQFGLLEEDSWKVRDTWKLLDIQALMSSPIGGPPEDYPCERQVLGNACGN
mmetsp:Transcript_105714/g.188025  ORF Transcript_105714/g.188025 Transcript_105714/m.188025 type:complete len:644 (-) Transcript_105714:49-1980(-)